MAILHSLRTSRIVGSDVFAYANEWNELAKRRGNYFTSEVWARNWWRHLADQGELQSLVVTDGPRLTGLLSFTSQELTLTSLLPVRSRAYVTTGSLWGGADHMDPLVDRPDQFPSLAKEMVDLWLSAQMGQTTMLPSVSLRDGWDGVRLARMVTEYCPQTRIPEGATFDDITSGWTRNRRKKLGQIQRRFVKAGGIVDYTTDPDRITSLLPTMFDLHRSRMKTVGKRSNFGWDPRHQRFHRSLCSEAQPELRPWLQICWLDKQPIAALYGFHAGASLHVYQSGWDPEAADSSPGLLQYTEALSRAVESGIRVFDMCRGPDEYKLRFATHVVGESTLAHYRGIGGSFLRAQAFARRMLKRKSRGQEKASIAGFDSPPLT